MKTGKAAKLFGLDPNTISDWTNRFEEFFTADARGEGRSQRFYHTDDLIILNTIRHQRSESTEWETIRAKLGSGYRDTRLPPEATHLEGDSAIAVYSQLRLLEAQLESERRDNEELRQELEGERAGRRQDNERNIGEIRRLEREVGKWQALADLYRSQVDDEADD